MNFNKLISVIVPVYNVEEYLEECLDSIQCQTYKNIEVILVNDGSTDLSKDICEKLGLQNAKVTAQLNNLLTWSAAGNDIDPEAYNLNTGTRSLPIATTALFGISFSF